MTDINPISGHFTIWNVIVLCTSVAAVSASAGWSIGRTLLSDERDLLRDELDQYKKANEWKIPDTIKKLNVLSERVNISLEEHSRLAKVTEDAQQCKIENDRLQKEIHSKIILLDEVQARLNSLEGETFNLEIGKSRFVIGKTHAIGVLDKNSYAKTCTVQFSDKKEEVYIGKTLKVSDGFNNVSVTLLELISGGCKFSINYDVPDVMFGK